MFEKDFSHGSKFTGYMEIVVRLVEDQSPGKKSWISPPATDV